MQSRDLGEIEVRRRKLGLTQTELANRAGVSQSLIARIENGAVDPRYSKVVRIFKALEESGGREVTAVEIMTPKVVGIQKIKTMESAAKKMKKHGVSQMPVYDGDKITGSISEKTILDEIAGGVDGRSLSSETVGSHTENAFPTVSPQTPLSAVSALLEHNTAVIVQDRIGVSGIITNADLLKTIRG